MASLRQMVLGVGRVCVTVCAILRQFKDGYNHYDDYRLVAEELQPEVRQLALLPRQ